MSVATTTSYSYPQQQTRGQRLVIGNGNASIVLSISSFKCWMRSIIGQEGMLTARQFVLETHLGFVLKDVPKCCTKIIAEYAISYFFDVEESLSLKDYVSSDLARRGMRMPSLSQVRRITALVPTSSEDIGFTLNFRTSQRAFLTYRESFLVSNDLKLPKHHLKCALIPKRHDGSEMTFLGQCDHHPTNDANILLLPLNEDETQVDEMNATYVEVMPDNGAVVETLSYESEGSWHLKDTQVWEAVGNRETSEALEYQSRRHQFFNPARFFLSFIRERHFERLIASGTHPDILASLRSEAASDS